jgi:hypothetical protein
MLDQPVRAGGLALAYALATSTLVLVAFLVSNLVLSTIGGIGQVVADPSPSADAPPAAVLLSSERDDAKEKRCDRRERHDVEERRGAADRCADQRRGEDRTRP